MKYYSCYWTIIRGMQDNPVPLPVSFFTKNPYFVGYEAGNRMCDLVKKWLVERCPFDKVGKNGQKYALYALTEKGKDLKLEKPTFVERIKYNFSF